MSAHASLRVHETVHTLSNPMIGAADAETRAAAETDVTETENALTAY